MVNSKHGTFMQTSLNNIVFPFNGMQSSRCRLYQPDFIRAG